MAFPADTIMTKDQKIIRAKAGVLELAKRPALLSAPSKKSFSSVSFPILA
jgi:hypothetical protein